MGYSKRSLEGKMLGIFANYQEPKLSQEENEQIEVELHAMRAQGADISAFDEDVYRSQYLLEKTRLCN